MTTFSHLNASGEASMIDVSNKESTERVAIAEARVLLSSEIMAQVGKQTIAMGIVIDSLKLLKKTSGKSGDWEHGDD